MVAFTFIIVAYLDPFTSYSDPSTLATATSTAPSSITSPPFPTPQLSTLILTFTAVTTRPFLPLQAPLATSAALQVQVVILVIGLRPQQVQLGLDLLQPLLVGLGLVRRPSFLFCLFINKNSVNQSLISN